MNPKVFVGMDWRNGKDILNMAKKLSVVESDFGFKVNLDHIAKPQRYSLRLLKEKYGKPVFADVKMANGRRTMIDAVKGLAEESVDFTNIYAFMGDELKATIDAVKDEGVKIFGLTVLTHFDDAHCQKIYGRSLIETVRMFAKMSKEVGCDGVIVPGTALERVRDIDIPKIVPGVRPPWWKDDRHKQKITDQEAFSNGADAIVVGSPITKVKKPAIALEKILQRISV